MIFHPQAYLLTNKIQHYEWGQRGKSAYIAQLLKLDGVQDDKPFAEMWMGTHPLGTSTVDYEGQPVPLSALVQRHPQEILGARVASTFENQFPFLLKVLSANEPLSIQVHPSKDEALSLHQKDAAHYPDTNHKPEIAIALDALQALAGLRDGRQTERLLKQYPPLANFVEFKTFSGRPQRSYTKLAFLSLLRNAVAKPDELVQVAAQLAARLNKKNRRTYREKLFLEMSEKYPGDVGLLSIFFLKLFTLKKGQAMYIPAGVPHAYLKGDIVECMASSDNVIRAGLTPKFKDIPALLEVVTDKPVIRYTPKSGDYVYSTPASEFRVSKFVLKPGQRLSEKSDSVRLLLVLRGKVRLAWQDGTPRPAEDSGSYAGTGTTSPRPVKDSGSYAGTGTTSLEVAQGACVLLPANLSEVGIECIEASEIYKADVP
jgi:mannose-6-phosphate isomerase